MVDAQQKIIRAIRIVKPYHAQALVDGWLCIKYLDGREESLSTFADVSRGDMILYGNTTRSRPHPAPAQPIESTKGMEHRKSRPDPDGSTGAPELEESRHTCINLNEHDATIRNQILDDIQKGEEPTSYTWRKAESLRRTKE